MTEYSDIGLNVSLAVEVGRHLLISLITGTIIYWGYGKYPRRVAEVALFVILIDLDHFPPLRDITGGPNMFHNLLFAMAVPVFFMLLFYFIERGNSHFSKTYTSSLFFVMLMGHIFYDGMDKTPILLYYPLSERSLFFKEIFLGYSWVGHLDLAVISVFYYAGLVLVFHHIVEILSEKEELVNYKRQESRVSAENSENDKETYDTSLLWPDEKNKADKKKQ